MSGEEGWGPPAGLCILYLAMWRFVVFAVFAGRGRSSIHTPGLERRVALGFCGGMGVGLKREWSFGGGGTGCK